MEPPGATTHLGAFCAYAHFAHCHTLQEIVRQFRQTARTNTLPF